MNRLLNEPVALAATVQSIIGFCIIMNWLSMTDAQTGSLMIAINAVLGLMVRSQVTPNQLAEARVDAGGRPTTPLQAARPEIDVKP
jgi:hypothetical protein